MVTFQQVLTFDVLDLPWPCEQLLQYLLFMFSISFPLLFFPFSSLLSADSTCIDSMTHMALPAFHTRHADTVCVSMIHVENLQNMHRCGKHPTEGYCRGNVVAGPAFRTRWLRWTTWIYTLHLHTLW